MDGSKPIKPCKVQGVKNTLRKTLTDGKFHGKNELLELTNCKNPAVLRVIVGNIRKELPEDETIICELSIGRMTGYRLIKLYKSH